MAFGCGLMADPVVASDGKTYEREHIERWMKTHDVSPLTSKPFAHKFLIPNDAFRELIAEWCEQNGVPVPVAEEHDAEEEHAAAGGGAAAPLLQKPHVMCAAHAKEQLRFFCMGCDHAVCVICAGDSDLCKTHTTKALDTLTEELKADREEWAQVQEECRLGAEQLCLTIQADADAKIQCITREAAALQQQVRAAADERAACLGAIVQKREAREELVAGAAVSPQLAVKASPASLLVASALKRAKGLLPPAEAATFRAAAAPATAVGHIDLAPAVVDPEDAAAVAAPAAEAAAVAAIDALAGSTLLRRVTDRNKMQQFAALMRTRLAGKGYRLLYTWSSDGRTNASFHARCDNQVGGITRGLKLRFVTLWLQGPTLVIVRSTTGHTFGGYASAPWNSTSSWTNVDGCFLFLVENPHNDAPTCFECKATANAMLCAADTGPGFGIDFIIHNHDVIKSFTQFPAHYTDTLGRGHATFTGAKDFTPEDYEVWAVN
jgi:hypothetical protein